MLSNLLSAYDDAKPDYERLVDVLRALLTQVLTETRLRIHSVAGRVKDRESLSAKIVAAAGRYQTLDDVTDVAAIRVITYFADDVESVGRIISRELDVLEAHSSDKRELLSDREFGYLSLHYVVRLKAEYADVQGYHHVAPLFAEIQVRSILQHAWAEIEHDLGYKTSMAIPRQVRREFARLAALLEGADDSFVALRNLLRDYEYDLSRRVATEPSDVHLDVSSLRTYLHSSAVAAEINLAVGSSSPFAAPNDVIARHVRQLAMFGIETVGALEQQMRQERPAVVHVGRSLRGERHANGSEILPVVYLEYLLLARRGDQALVSEILNSMPSDLMFRIVAAVKAFDGSL